MYREMLGVRGNIFGGGDSSGVGSEVTLSNATDKFYFSPENFNVLNKMVQQYFSQEKMVVLKKTDRVKNVLLRALASSKKKFPQLKNIVEMNKSALTEAIPGLMQEVDLRPDIHRSMLPLDLANFSDESPPLSSTTDLDMLVATSNSIVGHVLPSNQDRFKSSEDQYNIANLESLFKSSSDRTFSSNSTSFSSGKEVCVEENVNNNVFVTTNASSATTLPAAASAAVVAAAEQKDVLNNEDLINKFEQMYRAASSLPVIEEEKTIQYKNELANRGTKESADQSASGSGSGLTVAAASTVSLLSQNTLLFPAENQENDFAIENNLYDRSLLSSIQNSNQLGPSPSNAYQSERSSANPAPGKQLDFSVRDDSYQISQNYLSISSADRYFFVGEKTNRYNFSVTFESQQMVTRRVPIHVNNPFNFDGTRLSQNTGPDGYDPTQPLGVVVGFYDLDTGVVKGLNVPAKVTNVIELRVDSVTFYFSEEDHRFSSQCFNDGFTLLHYPYLLLEIQELVSVYKSTSEVCQKNVIKIMDDKTYCHGCDNFGYHVFRTVGPEVFTFPNPVASLNRLSIRFLTPDGMEIKTRPETALLKSVQIVNNPVTGDLYIEIKTYEYQPIAMFPRDHIVHLQDCDWFHGTSYASGSPWQEFKNWLSRDSGHVLQRDPTNMMSQESTGDIYNKFYLKYPYDINWLTGQNAPKSFGSSSVSELMNLLETPTVRLVNGNMYNYTIQTNVSFIATSRTRSEKILSSNVRDSR